MSHDDIRNQAWFDTLSAKLGSTQLTHALAKIEALERENATIQNEIHETRRAWLGRDYGHLPLPEAVGAMRTMAEAKHAKLRAALEAFMTFHAGHVHGPEIAVLVKQGAEALGR